MNKTGVIYLLDRWGEVIDGKSYNCIQRRVRIIGDWRKLYAAMFYTCYIQIAPYADAQLVNMRGENAKKMNEDRPRTSGGRYASPSGYLRRLKPRMVLEK